MHQRIVSIISQIRQDVASHLSPEVILNTCKAVGHVRRKRILDPATTVHVLILQVLHGNTALNNLRHLTGLDLTDQAFCERREPRSLRDRTNSSCTGSVEKERLTGDVVGSQGRRGTSGTGPEA